MNHFPIFLATRGRRIVLAGGGSEAIAKLRLLMKTEAEIAVFASEADPLIEGWAEAGRIGLHRRAIRARDLDGAALAYGATGFADADRALGNLARAAAVPFNLVDNLGDSGFITPAIVDRAPVVVAIGTEGAAPVLARSIKERLEGWLSPTLGAVTRAAAAFRPQAEALPHGAPRREFWAEAIATAPDRDGLEALLARHLSAPATPGKVLFVGAGPGDPELLTLKARKALDRADAILHDRLVAPEVLELARREAEIIETGKQGFGPGWAQSDINAAMVGRAGAGLLVVRLKSGDPGIFGRLDEEIGALEAAGIAYEIIPGITAAAAAAAGIGQPLTARGRNHGLRIVTGHDAAGFTEQDWAALARPGAVAAIYMAKRAARFIQGRLLMHGADPATPVSVVENASRCDARTIAATLGTLEPELARAGLNGPAVVLLGIAPRLAAARDIREIRSA